MGLFIAVATAVGVEVARRYGPDAIEYLKDKGIEAGKALAKKVGLSDDPKSNTRVATAIVDKAFFCSQAYRDGYKPLESRIGILVSGFAGAGRVQLKYVKKRDYDAAMAARVGQEYKDTEGYLRYRKPSGQPTITPTVGSARRVIEVRQDPDFKATPMRRFRIMRKWFTGPDRVGTMEIRQMPSGRLIGTAPFNFSKATKEQWKEFERKEPDDKKTPSVSAGAAGASPGLSPWVLLGGLGLGALALFSRRKR